MDYQPMPNILLEALAYLGRRTGGYTGQYIAGRLAQRGVEDLTPFWTSFAPVGRLAEKLDRSAAVHSEQEKRLFTNLAGFPYSPIGIYSPAFLLFYPVLNRYDGDFSALMDYMRGLSADHVARHLMLSLELRDDPRPDGGDAAGGLMDSVQALDVPSDSKLALLDCFHRYAAFLEQTARCLEPVVAELEARREELCDACRPLGEEVEEAGPEAYLHRTSSFSRPARSDCCLRPFLFGLDTNLVVEPLPVHGHDVTFVFSGVLRRCLLDQISQTEDAATAAYEMVKLLGDRTRFDILCYLRDHSAYGQELSDRFGLARNTIHHHMSKLSNAGLVTCTVDGNRVYYAIDKPSVDRMLMRQRQLLLGDGRSPDHLA